MFRKRKNSPIFSELIESNLKQNQKPLALDPTTKKNIRLYVIKNKATVQQQAIRLLGPTAAKMTEKELITFHTLQVGNNIKTNNFPTAQLTQ